MKSQARLRLRRPVATQQVMPIVGGKRFFCPFCSVGIFTREGQVYTCNGCGEQFEGTPKIRMIGA